MAPRIEIKADYRSDKHFIERVTFAKTGRVYIFTAYFEDWARRTIKTTMYSYHLTDDRKKSCVAASFFSERKLSSVPDNEVEVISEVQIFNLPPRMSISSHIAEKENFAEIFVVPYDLTEQTIWEKQ